MHRWTTNNYNLTNSSIDYDPSMGQSQIVRQLFEEDDNANRFFVECGALDGELRSNTLYLERALGWGGLVIEVGAPTTSWLIFSLDWFTGRPRKL